MTHEDQIKVAQAFARSLREQVEKIKADSEIDFDTTDINSALTDILIDLKAHEKRHTEYFTSGDYARDCYDRDYEMACDAARGR